MNHMPLRCSACTFVPIMHSDAPHASHIYIVQRREPHASPVLLMHSCYKLHSHSQKQKRKTQPSEHSPAQSTCSEKRTTVLHYSSRKQCIKSHKLNQSQALLQHASTELLDKRTMSIPPQLQSCADNVEAGCPSRA